MLLPPSLGGGGDCAYTWNLIRESPSISMTVLGLNTGFRKSSNNLLETENETLRILCGRVNRL